MDRVLNDWLSTIVAKGNHVHHQIMNNMPESLQQLIIEKQTTNQHCNGMLLTLTFCAGITTGATVSLCLSGYLLLPDFEYHFRSFCNDYNLFCAFGTEVIVLTDSNQQQKSTSNSNHELILTAINAGLPSSACRYVVDVPCRVMPYLIDRNQHINNARYIYELNFTRRYSFQRLGITNLVTEMGGNMVIQAQTIRYRREMKLWQKYFVRTSIIAWSDKERCFYVESRFLNEDKSFVLAIHHAKYKIVPKPQNSSKSIMDKTINVIDGNTSSRKREINEDLVPSRILAELGLISDELITETVGEGSFISIWEHANKVSSQSLNPSRG